MANVTQIRSYRVDAQLEILRASYAAEAGRERETVFRIIGGIMLPQQPLEIIGRIMHRLSCCLGMRLRRKGSKECGTMTRIGAEKAEKEVVERRGR